MIKFTRTRHGYFVSPTCTLAGDIRIGELSSFWFGTVVRGDVAPVIIGKRVNVQDNVVVHCDSGIPNVIEDDVTIGHSAVVHGAFVGKGSLIGMGAKVLGESRIGAQCLVAAGAVVPPGLEVPDGMVVMGVPGKIIRPVRDKELLYMQHLTTHYVRLAERYVEHGFPDLRS